MRFLFIQILLLLVTQARVACAIDGPLQISPLPSGWKLQYQGTNGIDFYSVTSRKEGSGVLMFSKWPPPSRPEDIPALVRKLADGFVMQAKNSPEFTLTSEKYEVQQFAGDHCKGNYAIFQIKSADGNNTGTLAVFMMSVDRQIWNGQFNGKMDDWVEALKLLKAITKKGY